MPVVGLVTVRPRPPAGLALDARQQESRVSDIGYDYEGDDDRAAGDAELVNYRVQGRYMVVDRLFAAAELRLGDRRNEQRVRIVRDDGRERRP